MNLTPEEIENSFLILGLPVIPDKQKIYTAWKKKASQFHPDKADTPRKKDLFHIKFIELIQARDTCINAINSSLIDDFVASESSSDINQDEPKVSKVKNEWEEFINNSELYFSKSQFIYNLIKNFIKIFFSSLLLSILFAISGMGLGILILGILSRAPNLPVLFWILTPISLLFIIFYLYIYLQYLDTFTLKLLIQIGYPFKYYILVWIFENVILITLIYCKIEYSLYIFLLINLGFLIQYQRIYNKILKVEEILLNKTSMSIKLS